MVYKLMVVPAYNDVLELRAKADSLEAAYETYGSFKKQMDNLLAQYSDLESVESQFSLIFPKKMDIAYVINQTINIAKINGLEIQSINVKPLTIKPSKEGVKGVGTLRTEARFSGGYQNFKSFLKMVEENVLISDASSFKIEKQGTEFLYNVAIDAYYQAE